MEIAGNVFIVSGAGSGLGAAVARMIVAQGGMVVAADLRTDALAALVADADSDLAPGTDPGGETTVDTGAERGNAPLAEPRTGRAARIRAARCDVTSEDDCRAVVGIAGAMGPLRGLISCAGILDGQRTAGRDGPHDLALFARVVGVNLIGTFNLLRLAADAMARLEPEADGERGVIVNTASIAAFDGQVGQAAYAASKGGVAAMTLPIARDLARSGIRCVALAPGLFETPMLAGMAPEARAALGAQVPFPTRLGKPAEFAHLVQEVIGNVMLNGEVIRLDGALRMPPR
jgi:NAD(P)-dependent dehydrogenase (short-subunit alcohol dehydrogenase family)